MSTELARIDYPTVQRMAHELANAGDLVPPAFRDKPAKCVAAILYGAELGLGPMTSLQSVVVVNGKPTLSAGAWAAMIRKAGHSIVADVTDTQATVTGRRRDNGDEMTVTFTIEDAAQAKLSGKDVWKQYPKSMLFARALTQLARQLFADVGFGGSIYTAEELGEDDVVEAERVDVETVPAPSEADVAEVEAGIAALDDDTRAELKAQLVERFGARSLHRYSKGELDAVRLMAADLSGRTFPELLAASSEPPEESPVEYDASTEPF